MNGIAQSDGSTAIDKINGSFSLIVILILMLIIIDMACSLLNLNNKCKFDSWIVPWLRRLVACLSPRRPGFDPGSVHVGFMVNKVVLGQVFRLVLRFSPVNFIALELHYLEK
jgi:hypothetical protein